MLMMQKTIKLFFVPKTLLCFFCTEDGLIQDFQKWLEDLALSRLDYKHYWTGEDNADAHLKRTLLGH